MWNSSDANYIFCIPMAEFEFCHEGTEMQQKKKYILVELVGTFTHNRMYPTTEKKWFI